MARMAEARTTANAMGELARGDTLAVGTRRGIGAARSEQSAARSERLKPGCHDLDACGRRHAWTGKTPDSWIVRDCPLPMEKKNHQLFRQAQERGPSAQPVSSAPASTSYWRRRSPPVWIRIPQLSSPLSSA